MEMVEKNLLQSCTPTENLQDNLLKYLRKRNYNELQYLLDKNRVDVNFEYDTYGMKRTALLTVCMENSTNEECIQLLLDHEADVLYLDEMTEKTALHFAAENNNGGILKTLLAHLQKLQIDIAEYNLYYSVIEYIRNDDKNEEDFLNIIQILLTTEIDINIPDTESGWTAIYMAAKYKYKQIISMILNERNGSINVDDEINGKTARDLITENNLFNGELKYYHEETCGQLLLRSVRQKKVNKFKEAYLKFKNDLNSTQQCELLQLAVHCENFEAAKLLLENSVPYNNIIQKHVKDLAIYDLNNPFILACVRGYHQILNLFFKNNPKPNSALMSQAMIELQKTTYKKAATEVVNHEKCTDLLLKHNKYDINYKDHDNKNTALHLAARYQSSDVVLQLLNNGASLACRDSYGKLPIADLTPKTFETHLNNCITYENEDLSRGDKSSSLNINLTSLLPPRRYVSEENSNSIKMEDERPQELTIEDLSPETEVLQYLCMHSEMREFLKHPVILAFIYLKWHRIRLFFYINLCIYSIFIISLITYITVSYNTKSTEFDFWGGASYVVLIITFVILIIREAFQMVIFKLRYFKSIENWLEMCLLVITGLILLVQSEEHVVRQMSAITIVLSAIEFLLLVGQFPDMSTHVMMLRTVSLSFFKLLCWYSILLFAFAYSFFTLFQETDTTNNPNNSTSNEEEEQDFFEDPGMSLLKTIVMLTGEFDAQSLKFNSYPIISHLIFVLFVFLIAIVLFNLLNGLAVSDTQIIKTDAQLYGQILKIEDISHIERILLQAKFIRVLPMLKEICLFPRNCKEAYLLVYPNQDNLVMIEHVKKRTVDQVAQSCFKSCNNIYLDKKIVRSVRDLMQHRDEEIDKMERDEKMLRAILEKIMLEKSIT